MEYFYKVELNCDPAEADVIKHKQMNEIIDKYNALSIGHEATDTSTLYIRSEKPLIRKKLEEEFTSIDVQIDGFKESNNPFL
jgi:hypothetical protein